MKKMMFSLMLMGVLGGAVQAQEQAMPAPVVPAIETMSLPTKALYMPVSKVSLAGKPLNVELAITTEQHTTGLMFRSSLAKDAGMLFVFSQPQRLCFWMHNTQFPVSLAYFNKNREVLSVYEMDAMSQQVVCSPTEEAQYALEVNRGWFEKNGVKVGDRLQFDR